MRTIMAMVNNYGEVICELEQDGCWYKVPKRHWVDVLDLLCEGDVFKVEEVEVDD